MTASVDAALLLLPMVKNAGSRTLQEAPPLSSLIHSPHLPDPGIPKDFTGQRQFDGCIFKFSDAASRKSPRASKQTIETSQARLISSIRTVENPSGGRGRGNGC